MKIRLLIHQKYFRYAGAVIASIGTLMILGIMGASDLEFEQVMRGSAVEYRVSLVEMAATVALGLCLVAIGTTLHRAFRKML